MRWPDIFWGAKKRREDTSPEPAAKPASTVTPTTAIKPEPASETSTKTEEPAPSSSNPALRPAVRANKPVVLSTTPTPIPIATEEDPLKVFARANSIRLAKKADQVVSSSETTPTAAPEPIVSGPAPTESPREPIAEAIPSPESSSGPAVSSIAGRRKAKLTDVARIIPASDSTESDPEPPSAVSPPAFTVAVPVGNITQPEDVPKTSDAPVDKPTESSETKAPESVHVEHAPSTPQPEVKPDAPAPDQTPKSETPLPSTPFEHLPAKTPEKKEFLLVNGERIFGHVLSETPDTIYLDHGTLGVLTLPRSQIAAHPVEIILINGDRIVGDIMAETADNLYVRHASLGMLTVPRAQRSTRVVEAILKDGDRILGEVLAETENFTVIRSATLGTVPVPHDKIAMLNRKLEQITLKALPTAAPALEDKSKP